MRVEHAGHQTHGDGREEPAALPVSDPMEALGPTAQRILTAARRLLIEGGFRRLSLQTIATAAGESKGSIAYHFGSKEGLITALIDSLVHDANRALLVDTAGIASLEERLKVLVAVETRIAADRDAAMGVLEVLPYAMRDDKLRPRVAALYAAYRETVLACLRGSASVRPELLAPAALTIAVVDGLSIQLGLEPERTDVPACFEAFGEMVSLYLRAHATD
jgi:TetR/AcrR family transcriptional regulator, acrAB operon repressor